MYKGEPIMYFTDFEEKKNDRKNFEEILNNILENKKPESKPLIIGSIMGLVDNNLPVLVFEDCNGKEYPICNVTTIDTAFYKIKIALDDSDIDYAPSWGIHKNSVGETVIDFGSHTSFFKIIY